MAQYNSFGMQFNWNRREYGVSSSDLGPSLQSFLPEALSSGNLDYYDKMYLLPSRSEDSVAASVIDIVIDAVISCPRYVSDCQLDGSRRTGTPTPGSDIDVLCYFDR